MKDFCTIYVQQGGIMCVILAIRLFCTGILSSQLEDLLSAKITPEISFSCLNIPENQEIVINEIANFYGRFLTPQIHEKGVCRKLRNQGMWLEIKDARDYFPESKEVTLFVQNLKDAMKADFIKDNPLGKECTKLGMDYGPDPGALREAFYKTGLDVRCNCLFPYKSLTYIEIKEGLIWIYVWLKGSVI